MRVTKTESLIAGYEINTCLQLSADTFSTDVVGDLYDISNWLLTGNAVAYKQRHKLEYYIKQTKAINVHVGPTHITFIFLFLSVFKK